MKKSFLYALFSLLLTGCSTEPHFRIQGSIAEASGEILFFEALEADSIRPIASQKLDENGTFKFKAPVPESPEFYRLRINGKAITFVADTIETITLKTQNKNFAADYTLTADKNEAVNRQIQTLARLGGEIKRALDQSLTEKEPSPEATQKILDAVAKYKEEAFTIIRNTPGSPAAYFGLQQQVNNMVIFDLYDPQDFPLFAAVATMQKELYPKSERIQRLYNSALAQTQAKQKEKQLAQQFINTQETGYLEIELPNKTGKIIPLSTFIGEKAVLLNFTSYKTAYSPEFNRQLAAIYDRYSEKGLEIYQIALDREENFWKVASSNLPWITVHDNSVESVSAKRYQVTTLPTSFLIDKAGNIIKRIENHAQLEQEVKTLL